MNKIIASKGLTNNHGFNGVDVYFHNGSRYVLQGTLYYKTEGVN